MRDADNLARVIVKGNPARTPKDARPDAAAVALRDQITAVPPSHLRTLPRVIWSTAAVMLVIAVAVIPFLTPSSAVMAVTPEPIVFTAGGTVAEIADDATSALTHTEGRTVPVRAAQSESWGLAVDPESQQLEIVPQVMMLEWDEDLSGRMTVVAGTPYWPSDASSIDDKVPPAAPGEVLSEFEFAAGEFGTPVVTPPGNAREDVLALLTAFGMPKSPKASEVVQSMTGVLEQWGLTNAQHAQLLSILVGTGELTALGSGTDRAGRPVVGVETQSIFPGVKDLVLISAETGRIVGVESARVTPDGIVPAGAVISYRLWDTI